MTNAPKVENHGKTTIQKLKDDSRWKPTAAVDERLARGDTLTCKMLYSRRCECVSSQANNDDALGVCPTASQPVGQWEVCVVLLLLLLMVEDDCRRKKYQVNEQKERKKEKEKAARRWSSLKWTHSALRLTLQAPRQNGNFFHWRQWSTQIDHTVANQWLGRVVHLLCRTSGATSSRSTQSVLFIHWANWSVTC